ncbi:coiled-coil domain-containing protein-domain-containing protein [Biscogniauxia marginata]|nr:coiled-coil domain-containing protein-domain-containing protein [Biscogniauxia marginata]
MPHILDMAPESSPTRAYVKPQPRPPKSPAHSAQIRVQNRRREYLERHPSYLDSLEHELADPLLYDALIRRFQSPAEREAEGRAKGYSRVLEVDLLRGEARLSHLAADAAQGTASASASAADQDAYIREYADFAHPLPRLPSDDDDDDDDDARLQYREEEQDKRRRKETAAAEVGAGSGAGAGAPETREEGRERWRDFLRRRFVLGRDDDFEYRGVDEDEDYDALERREREDAWFEDEVPGWASDDEEDEDEDEDQDQDQDEDEDESGGRGSPGAEGEYGDGEGDGEGREREKGRRRRNEKIERPLRGETGIQDF